MDVPSFLLGVVVCVFVLLLLIGIGAYGYKIGRDDERRGVK